MRKLSRFLAIGLFVLAATTNTYAKMDCSPGLGVYSPISGDLADCLEGGGDDCLSCFVVVLMP